MSRRIPLRVNGTRLAAEVHGEGPLVVCMHGFPDTGDTFKALWPELVAAGLSVAILTPRGYAAGSRAHVQDCALRQLGRDVVSLIGVLGGRAAAVIGHDWGAVGAYAAAAIAPGHIARIVTAAVPHPRRFLHLTPAQLRRSWYMALFQLPVLPEWLLRRNDYHMVERLWRAWSPGRNYTAEDIAPVKRVFDQPGSLRGALNYYRAQARALLNPMRADERRTFLAPTPVPTLSVAGADDGCIGREMFAGQARWHPAGYRHLCLEGAGHFMHREQPQAFATAVLDYLAPELG